MNTKKYAVSNHQFEDHFTSDMYLPDLLGLNDQLRDFLEKLDDAHRTSEEWILDYIKARAEEKYPDWPSKCELLNIFYKLGFNKKTCNLLANATFGQNHQLPVYFAEHYIEQHLSRYKGAFQKKNVDDDLLDQVRSQSRDCEYTLASTGSMKFENIATSATELGSNQALSRFFDPVLEEKLTMGRDVSLSDVKYWFHGTSHKSAMDIARNGIRKERGKRGDFTCPDSTGFYVSSDLHFAFDWGGRKSLLERNGRDQSAVIVFEKIDGENLSNFKNEHQGREFKTADSDWDDFVKFFYFYGKPGQPEHPQEETFLNYQYIFGPMSGASPKRQYQFCIKKKWNRIVHKPLRIAKVFIFNP